MIIGELYNPSVSFTQNYFISVYIGLELGLFSFVNYEYSIMSPIDPEYRLYTDIFVED